MERARKKVIIRTLVDKSSKSSYLKWVRLLRKVFESSEGSNEFVESHPFFVRGGEVLEYHMYSFMVMKV